MLLFFKLVGLPFPLLTQNFPSVISKIRYLLAVIERNAILVLYKNIVLSNYIIILFFLVLWLAEIGFTIFCVIWMKNHYAACAISTGNKNMILGKDTIILGYHVTTQVH